MALEARLEPGNGSAQSILHLTQGGFILVALPGPEEPFEAILAAARDEVDMHVRDALTDTVVEGDKRSVGLQALLNGPFQRLCVLKQGADQGSGKVGQRLIMLPGH
jgi:hypothetical protein